MPAIISHGLVKPIFVQYFLSMQKIRDQKPMSRWQNYSAIKVNEWRILKINGENNEDIMSNPDVTITMTMDTHYTIFDNHW